ncbi:hypothetical protein MMC30_002038 [Trapelia coarctata]|nr:hypothetical protein [Trapelia coarctata]
MSPGNIGEKTYRKILIPRRPNSTTQKLEASMNSLELSKSCEHLATDATRDISTDTDTELKAETQRDVETANLTAATNPTPEQASKVPEAVPGVGFVFGAHKAEDAGKDTSRELKGDKKIDVESETETASGTATNLTIKSASDIFEAARFIDLSPGTATPFGKSSSDVKQTALDEEVRPIFCFQRPAFLPRASAATLPDEEPSGGHSSEAPLLPRETKISAVDFKSRAASHGRKAASVDLPHLSSDTDPPTPHGQEATSPNTTSNQKKVSDLSSCSNAASGGTAPSAPLMEGNIANQIYQPEMLVRPVESDRTRSMGAFGAKNQGPEASKTSRPSNSISAAILRHHSAPPAPPATQSIPTPVPDSRARSPSSQSGDGSEKNNEIEEICEIDIHAGERIANSNTIDENDEIDEINSSDKDDTIDEIDGESSEDDSRAIIQWSPPPGRKQESVPNIVMLRPTPGPLNVIWKWTFTKRRTKKPRAYFWIVQDLFRDLTYTETLDACIYAFRVKDPQANQYVKIGVTNNLKKRMMEHEQCYGEYERIYPPKDEDCVLFDQAKRAERMIHAELMEKALCLEVCPRQRQKHHSHGEWFDVDGGHAIKVIRKWCAWVRSSPYEEMPTTATNQKTSPRRRKGSETPSKSSSPQWQLKNLEHSIIADICGPLPIPRDNEGNLDETTLVNLSDQP